MIGMLLVSHGRMAEGMLDSLELIMGKPDYMDSVSLVAGEDFELLKQQVMQEIRRLNDGDGVLVFVDLFGASPYNAAQYVSMQLQKEGIPVRIVTGMNLAMVLESAALRTSLGLDALVETAKASGKDGIQEPILIEDEESDGDY